jgi:hypothetical protein
MPTNVLRLAALSLAGLAALTLAACGGEVTDPDANLQISDADTTSAALGSPDPGNTGEDADDDDDSNDPDGKGDHHKGGKARCNDRDHDQHHHHRHHKFKVLDRIDGTKDHVITIASLPAALPDRLIARLHAIDTDGDGLVTKPEAKAWSHAHGK